MNIKRKLSSRKLWAAVAGVIAGLAMVFGLDEGVISQVAGAVVSAASLVSYIITEGKVDAAGAASTASTAGVAGTAGTAGGQADG